MGSIVHNFLSSFSPMYLLITYKKFSKVYGVIVFNVEISFQIQQHSWWSNDVVFLKLGWHCTECKNDLTACLQLLIQITYVYIPAGQGSYGNKGNIKMMYNTTNLL